MSNRKAKAHARPMVAKAVASGELTRPDVCELCGARPKRVLDAHHQDHSQPLSVLWLCQSCHRLAHPRPKPAPRPPRPPRPGSARARVEAELRRDPARSDAIIVQLARCTAQAAGRWRRGLERAGVIEVVKPADRLAIPRTWRARPPRQAVERGASTPAEVMALSGASYGAAWRALDRARARPRLADAAAAIDALSVIKAPPKRVGKAYVVGNQLPEGYYRPADAIELWCCTLEYTPDGWQHDRACVLRLSSAR